MLPGSQPCALALLGLCYAWGYPTQDSPEFLMPSDIQPTPLAFKAFPGSGVARPEAGGPDLGSRLPCDLGKSVPLSVPLFLSP